MICFRSIDTIVSKSSRPKTRQGGSKRRPVLRKSRERRQRKRRATTSLSSPR